MGASETPQPRPIIEMLVLGFMSRFRLGVLEMFTATVVNHYS